MRLVMLKNTILTSIMSAVSPAILLPKAEEIYAQHLEELKRGM